MRVVNVSWPATVPLRSTVLGWDDSPTKPDLDPEAGHLALVDAEEIIAVVSMMPWPCPGYTFTPAVYLWGMAVAAGRQRSGCGRRLLSEVVDYGRRRGAHLVWADARTSAIPFYEACGARAIGEPYVDEVTGRLDRRIVIEISDPARSPERRGL